MRMRVEAAFPVLTEHASNKVSKLSLVKGGEWVRIASDLLGIRHRAAALLFAIRCDIRPTKDGKRADSSVVQLLCRKERGSVSRHILPGVS